MRCCCRFPVRLWCILHGDAEESEKRADEYEKRLWMCILTALLLAGLLSATAFAEEGYVGTIMDVGAGKRKARFTSFSRSIP